MHYRIKFKKRRFQIIWRRIFRVAQFEVVEFKGVVHLKITKLNGVICLVPYADTEFRIIQVKEKE